MPLKTFYIVPQSSGSTVRVLLGQRQLIQRWVEGKQVQGLIPAHAGQWALFGGLAEDTQDLSQAAIQLFLNQTGIDLADPNVAARYCVSAQELKLIQDNNHNTFHAYYFTISDPGMDGLAKDTSAHINNRSVRDGVFLAVAAKEASQAERLLGPTPAPAEGGWRAYLVTNYYDGKSPGQLNTDIDTLTNQITQSSQDSDAWYRLALQQRPAIDTRPKGMPMIF